jgi:hypothetical protein
MEGAGAGPWHNPKTEVYTVTNTKKIGRLRKTNVTRTCIDGLSIRLAKDIEEFYDVAEQYLHT